jgi:hypothetical protein
MRSYLNTLDIKLATGCSGFCCGWTVEGEEGDGDLTYIRLCYIIKQQGLSDEKISHKML